MLRNRLEVGLDTRAAEYLKRIRGDLEATPALNELLEGLKKLDLKSIDNRQPGDKMAAIFNAIKPKDEGNVQSNKAFSNQPEWFKELYKQIKKKILSLGEVQTLIDSAEQTKRELARLIDTIKADIKSLERVPTSGASLGGGKTKPKATRRRKLPKTKRNPKKHTSSQKHHKKVGKTRKNHRK